MTDDRPEVLFVCVHNAGRSQMAAAYLAHLAGDRVEVRSAGSAPADSVNPAVVEAMLEEGIDISAEVPKVLTAEAVEAEETLTSYTSESTSAEDAPKKERPALTVAGAAVGRRKEAVARVRVVPGSGKWTINGRTLDNYFPNKLHQQDVNEPFKILDLEGAYDVIARIHGGGISGQALRYCSYFIVLNPSSNDWLKH